MNRNDSMKCLICGSDISPSGNRCSSCGETKDITINRSLFAWTSRDKTAIKEKRKSYQDEQQKIHNEEQRRIQEENRGLEEQRKLDQKLAEERKTAEAKKAADDKKKEEQRKHEEARIREEQERMRKAEIERQTSVQNEKKSNKKRNIIIAVIIFLIICGIASNFEETSNYIPPEPITDTTGTTSSYNSGENVIEYVSNDWDNNRVVLNNWEVPFKAYGKYIENCSSFTLEFSISDIIDGNPYGVWIVYLRNKNGVWNEITTFAHAKSHGEEASSIEIKTNSTFEPFDAIALARKANDSSNHSFWYDTKNFVIDD